MYQQPVQQAMTGPQSLKLSLRRTRPPLLLSQLLQRAGEVATGGLVAMTGDGDGNELEVVMGHSGLQTLRHISLSEAMGMTHFSLRQAQDVLQWERADIEEEQQCLMEWGSLLKE
jgi:hypothetical protein